MANLDRKRDFATIVGDDEGRMFEQDGKFFNGDGTPWRPRKEGAQQPAASKTTPAPAPAKPEQPADDEQLSQQLKG